jgi:HAMP domain-containing protein
VTLAISLLLGAFLWRTSSQVIEKSKVVSEQGRITIQTVYGDNPELAKSYADEAAKSDAMVLAQQRSMMTGIVGGLGVLVVLIGLLGIFVTHKVAGPVHKMKFLLRNVAEGRLHFSVRALRKGDELQDFFEEFIVMIDKVKARRRAEIARLDEGIAAARASGVEAAALEKLEAFRDSLQRSLEY